jgi:hypothetical protein
MSNQNQDKDTLNEAHLCGEIMSCHRTFAAFSPLPEPSHFRDASGPTRFVSRPIPVA